MKKLILAGAMILGIISFSFAQTSDAKATKPVKEKKEAKKPVAQSDAKTATPAKSPVAKKALAAAITPATEKTTDKSGTVLKKDGTPDKRFTATKSKKPLKKDGTPDQRFKENKKP